MFLKVKSGRFNRVLVMEPLLTRNARPSIADRLLCKGYIIALGLAEDFLPELAISINFIELEGIHLVYTP